MQSLMCKFTIIESIHCLCACYHLLKVFIAYVQPHSYWHFLLLMCSKMIIDADICSMCISQIIEFFICLCAVTQLLKPLIAYVHRDIYWYAITSLLIFAVAYVHATTYWKFLLLMCKTMIIDASRCSMCSREIIDGVLLCNWKVIEALYCFCALIILIEASSLLGAVTPLPSSFSTSWPPHSYPPQFI